MVDYDSDKNVYGVHELCVNYSYLGFLSIHLSLHFVEQ